MASILPFIPFFIIFIGAYGLLNFYVLSRFATLFGTKRGKLFYAILAILTLSLLVAMALARSEIGRASYIIAMTWLGSVFILACILGLHELARLVIKLPDRRWAVIALGAGCFFVIIALVSAATIRVNEVEIASPKITAPLRVVQVTDIHLGPVYDKAYLERVVNAIRSANPDIVVITGDLIDGPGAYDPDLLQPFDAIGKPVFFVTGNHEGYDGKEMDVLLSHTKIMHLKNNMTSVDGVQLIGIDDRNDRHSVAKTLAEIINSTPHNSTQQNSTPYNSLQQNVTLQSSAHYSSAKYSILLYHRPGASWALPKTDSGVDLMLSGHTHAGQIFPFTLLVATVEYPVIGLHKVNEFMLYVSPGTGTWGPPMRLGTTEEVTLIRLEPGNVTVQ